VVHLVSIPHISAGISTEREVDTGTRVPEESVTTYY